MLSPQTNVVIVVILFSRRVGNNVIIQFRSQINSRLYRKMNKGSYTLRNGIERMPLIARSISTIAILTARLQSENKDPRRGRRAFDNSWLAGLSSKYVMPCRTAHLTEALDLSRDVSSISLERSFTVVVGDTTSQNNLRIRQTPSTAVILMSGHGSVNNFSKKTNCLSNRMPFSSFEAFGSSKGNISISKSNAFRRTFELATCPIKQKKYWLYKTSHIYQHVMQWLLFANELE